MKNVTLRLPEAAGPVEVALPFSLLVHQLVHEDSIPPTAQALCDGAWLPLDAWPHRPWLDQTSALAAQAIRDLNPVRARRYADKTLRFAGQRRDLPAVRIALIISAHLLRCEGRLWDAIGPLEEAIGGPATVEAVAHNNLAVTWALLRNPVTAVRHLEAARVADPAFFASDLSLQNLAATLVAERAPNSPRHAKWEQLRSDAQRRLSSVGSSAVLDLQSPRRAFPTYHVIHIFPRQRFLPGIGSLLPQEETASAFAASLLAAAHKALGSCDPVQARLLASLAVAESPRLQPAADEILVAAAGQSQWQAGQQRAGYMVQRLQEFFQTLAATTLDNLDLPREALELLRPMFKEITSLERLHRGRVLDLLFQELEHSTGSARARIEGLLAQLASGDSAAAYQQAAAYRRSLSDLETYWTSLQTNAAEPATQALDRAEQRLGFPLAQHRTILAELREAG